jgi:hypothetical protein
MTSLMPLLLLLAAAEVPFEASADRFADTAACHARLLSLVAEARGSGADAAEGPYEVAQGDVRMHSVRLDGAGHRITETRCLAERLSARSWTHVFGEEEEIAEAEEPFTVDSVARSAEWLKKAPTH